MRCNQKWCPAIIGICYFIYEIHSPKEISKVTGIPISTVHQVLKRKYNATKKRKKVTESEIDAIRRDYINGVSTYEMERKYGVSHKTISKWMNKQGYRRGRNNPAYTFSHQKRLHEESIKRLVDEFGEDAETLLADFKSRRKMRIALRDHDFGITWKAVAKRNDSMKCEICGCECDANDHRWGKVGPKYPSVDHIKRLVDGGTHTWDNVRLACLECNQRMNIEMNRSVMRSA